MRRASALGMALAVMLGLFCLCSLAGKREHHWTKAETDKMIADALREEAREAEQAAQTRARMPVFSHTWHPPQVKHGTKTPAPTLRRGPTVRNSKGEKMPTWITDGTPPGEVSARGTFVETGTYNGKPAYTNGTWWLWWDTGTNRWTLSATKGETPDILMVPGYVGADGAELPANTWRAGNVGGGTSPAPTLAEQVSYIYPADDNPFRFPYATFFWPEDAPFVPSGSPLKPCRATIAGTSYVVFPQNGVAGVGPWGFILFDLTEHSWAWCPATGQIYTDHDPHQGGGLFDAGDGEHIHLCTGAYLNAEDQPVVSWTKWALVPGVSATEVAYS